MASTLPLKKVIWSDSSWQSSRCQGPSPGLVLRINSHLKLKSINSSGVGFIVCFSLPVHLSSSLLPRTSHFSGSSGSPAYPAASPLAWKSPKVQTGFPHRIVSLLGKSPILWLPFSSLCRWLSLSYLGRDLGSHLQSRPFSLVTLIFCHYFSLNVPQTERPVPSLPRPVIV